MNQATINTGPGVLHFILKPNSHFPNSQLPVLIYKTALLFSHNKKEAASTAEEIFRKNDWGNNWENGIYNFHHFHSNTHEVLAIASGNVGIILGGPDGRNAGLNAGDIIIIPAGVGHKCLSASGDFLCVGGYPGGKDYDICRGKADEFEEALKSIQQFSFPSTDPVYGKEGLIKKYWNLD
jgi:uncharacterized protein YjlB